LLTPKVDNDGIKLYAHLKSALPRLSYEAFQKLLRLKKVFINRQVTYKDRVLSSADTVEVRMSESALGKYRYPKVEIVYEDNYIITALKPQGVDVEGSRSRGSFSSWVRAQCAGSDAASYPAPCHRLETQLSGLVLFAKNQAAHAELIKAFKQGLVHRQYACLVRGLPSPRLGEITLPIVKDGKNAGTRVCTSGTRGALSAVTRYRVAATIGRLSVLEVNPVTARPYQTRVHLAAIGHPVVGDDKFGDRALNRKLSIRHEQLTANTMGFEMPEKSLLAYLSGVNIALPTPDFNIRSFRTQF